MEHYSMGHNTHSVGREEISLYGETFISSGGHANQGVNKTIHWCVGKDDNL